MINCRSIIGTSTRGVIAISARPNPVVLALKRRSPACAPLLSSDSSLAKHYCSRDSRSWSASFRHASTWSWSKSAKFARNHLIRVDKNIPECWKQMQPYHQSTIGLWINNLDENNRARTNYNHAICSKISLREFPSPLSDSYMNTLSNKRHMQISIRCMSQNGAKSILDFSKLGRMPHRIGATASKEQKETRGAKLDSLPASQKARLLFKKYGTVAIGSYFGIYFSTLFAFFLFLDSGLVDPETLTQILKSSKDMACGTADVIGPEGTGFSMNEAADAYAEEMSSEMTLDKRTMVDVIAGYLQNWEWTNRYADKLSENPHLANFAVAWFIVKLTEPLRVAATVIVTPKIAKALGQKELRREKKKESSSKMKMQ